MKSFTFCKTPPYIIGIIKSRRIRSAGQEPRIGDEKCLRVLVWKFEGKRSFGRPKLRW